MATAPKKGQDKPGARAARDEAATLEFLAHQVHIADRPVAERSLGKADPSAHREAAGARDRVDADRWSDEGGSVVGVR